MSVMRRTLTAVLAATVVSIGIGVGIGIGMGVAQAQPAKVVLGGSSGIVFNSGGACSLTTIGHDRTGRLVGLTAAHCAPVGALVAAEYRQQWTADHKVIAVGKVVARNPYLDYEVLQFDPRLVTPTRTIGATSIDGVAPYPSPGGAVCMNGRTTGFSCGVVWATMGREVLNQTCSRPGDSGAPVTAGDQLVGMNNGRIIGFEGLDFDVLCQNQADPVHSPAYTHPMTLILADLNAAGGPGAGYRPI